MIAVLQSIEGMIEPLWVASKLGTQKARAVKVAAVVEATMSFRAASSKKLILLDPILMVPYSLILTSPRGVFVPSFLSIHSSGAQMLKFLVSLTSAEE